MAKTSVLEEALDDCLFRFVYGLAINGAPPLAGKHGRYLKNRFRPPFRRAFGPKPKLVWRLRKKWLLERTERMAEEAWDLAKSRGRLTQADIDASIEWIKEQECPDEGAPAGRFCT